MNFQTVSTGQKLPNSKTEGDLSGTALGGYHADGTTPGPVLTNALDFIDQSLDKMYDALERRGLLSSTAIIVSAKNGESPMKLAALNRIDDGQIISALNTAWKSSHPGANLVAFMVHDDGKILLVNAKSDPATKLSQPCLM